MTPCIVVVGAGQAGGWGAKTLRDQGYEGRIVLIGEEAYPPHERPPLSKDLLLGKIPIEKTHLFPADSWPKWNVELLTGQLVTRIDRAEHRVELAGREPIRYDRLLLATGGRVRKLNLPGAGLDGVFYLRTISDTLAIRERISSGKRVLVAGAGWIGLEVAAAARQFGAEVVVVETLDQVCGRTLARELAQYVEAFHRGKGTDIRLKASVARFEGVGKVERAVLLDGSRIEADLVVIGIGIVPNVELAAEAGLAIDNGIVVDELCRTSDPEIFAAGDVANHPNALLGGRVRLESWENAQNQAIAAAKAMLDNGQAYAEIPWFWSDQYDMNLQLVGLPAGWDTTVLRGEPARGSFIAFYMKNGKINGAAAVNAARDVRFVRRLVQAAKPVDPTRLADPAVKLQDLLKG